MTVPAEIEAWAGSGAMALTGHADGPPQLVAGAPATKVREDLAALAEVAAAAGLDPSALPDERLLSERAAIMGLGRNGRISAGGASRLLPSADGAVAVTLSRPDDLASIPALISRDAMTDDPWEALTEWCRDRGSADVVERATLLGLAAGAVDHTVPAEPYTLGQVGGVKSIKRLGSAERVKVVDLSSLWAGPLCAHLLASVGAEVAHVSSTQRPDPTREVAPGFHRSLREGIEEITLDFSVADDLRRLHDLLLGADIVIEASRPRALAQLGFDAAAIAAEGRCTWVSITAYGRTHNRIGYGDDVAAAAGLLGTGPVFAGDAIADPMTGTHAARAALSHWTAGDSEVVDVAMYDVVRAARTSLPEAAVLRQGDEWLVDDGTRLIPVREPIVRERAQ